MTLADRSGGAVQALIDAQDETEAQLRELVETQSRIWGVAARLIVRTGDPVQVLTQVAAEVRAEAVIVGVSASLAHRFAGSLAVRLLRCRRWPVTVVP